MFVGGLFIFRGDFMKLVKVKCNEKVKAFLMIKLGYTPTFMRYRDKISPVLMTYKNFLKKYRNAQLYWIEENNRKIGEICFVLKDDTIHISDFFILNNHQNKGFGQNALELAEDMLCDFRQWHLFTIKQEKRNIHLYEKFGYTATDYERKINKRMTIVEYEKEICKNEHEKNYVSRL